VILLSFIPPRKKTCTAKTANIPTSSPPLAVCLSVIVAVSLAAALPHADAAAIDRQSCNGVVLQKAAGGDRICVFEESVAPLVDRGYANLGEAWAKVCNKYTQAAMTEGWTREELAYCEISTSPLDVCRAPNNLPGCLEIDIRPKTIRDCRDKYEFGYKTNVGDVLMGRPIPAYHLPAYASILCDLDHGQSRAIQDELSRQIRENGGVRPPIFATFFEEDRIREDFVLFWLNDTDSIGSKEAARFWSDYGVISVSEATYDGLELVFDGSHRDDLDEIRERLGELYPDATKTTILVEGPEPQPAPAEK